jgi:hypothetical protein
VLSIVFTFILKGIISAKLLFQTLTLFNPPLKQVYILCPNDTMFERGREFERGLRPLSLKLPSPSKNLSWCNNISGWRGDKGVR